MLPTGIPTPSLKNYTPRKHKNANSYSTTTSFAKNLNIEEDLPMEQLKCYK